MTRMHRKRNTIYDDEGHRVSLCDPFKLVYDGYSAGTRSWLPVLVKVFPSECHEKTAFRMLACPDAYATYTTHTGGVEQRDTTAEGLYHTLKHVITHGQFSDIPLVEGHPLADSAMGFTHFMNNCVEVSGDQGGGMTNCMELLRQKLPDLPDTRGESHLLMTLLKQSRTAQDKESDCMRCYTNLVDLSTALQTPKRASFAIRMCELAGLPWIKVPLAVKNRFAPSMRNVIECFIIEQRSLEFVVRCMLNTELYGKLEDDFKEVLDLCSAGFADHTWLLWLHQWYDLLNAVSIAIKQTEAGTATILTQCANRVALIERLDGLTAEENCLAVQQYKTSLKKKENMVYAEYRKVDNATGKTIRYFRCLGSTDDVEERNDVFTDSRLSLLADLSTRIKREMPVTPEMRAYNVVYNPREMKFDELRANPDYFVQSFQVVVARYKGTRLPKWVTIPFIREQARTLRDLLFNKRTEFEHTAHSETEATFWLTVRSAAGVEQINISLVLYLRKTCHMRNGVEAVVEQFNSVLHVFGEDAQRRTLSGTHLEDQLRCAYNGPSVKEFNPHDFIECYFSVFRMEPVRTVEQVSASSLANANDNARRRRVYATRRPDIKERRKDRYAKRIREQKVGRGELSTGVRPSFKRARLRLRQGLAEGQDGSDSGDAASGLSEEEFADAQAPSALTQNVVKVPARGSLSQRSETKQPKKTRRKRALVTSSDESDESEEEEDEVIALREHEVVTGPRQDGDVLVCVGEIAPGTEDDVPWIAVVKGTQSSRTNVAIRWLQPSEEKNYQGDWVLVRGNQGVGVIPEDSVIGTIKWAGTSAKKRTMGQQNWDAAVLWATEHRDEAKTHTHMHVRAHTHTRIRSRTHTHIRNRTHVHRYTHQHTHTHTCACTRTHAHTHAKHTQTNTDRQTNRQTDRPTHKNSS